MKFTSYIQALILTLAALASSAHAAWQLDKSQSEFYFTFIKAAQVGTVGHFESFDALATNDGKAQLTIDLASLNTGIEKRDGRLKELFFNVSKYPTADIQISMGHNIYRRLAVGETEKVRVTAKVSLHGKTRRLREVVNVTLLNKKTVEVTTAKPILLDAGDFGLLPGIQKLIDLAGVKSISQSVPVTFRLRFKQEA